MRKTFVQTLTELMGRDRKIVALTADMGYGVFEELQSSNPDRFINTGVSEANTVGIAAGLALSGYLPFFYAQAPFATMRCFEQVRLDVASNNLNVKIVGTSAGFNLSQYGVSHYAVEDVSLMRLLPNMTVICPGDLYEAKEATLASVTIKNPVYIRIGRSDSFGPDRLIHKGRPDFKIGKSILLNDGTDIAIIATGSMLLTACRVEERLKSGGISTALVSMHTVKPIDEEILSYLGNKVRFIFTIEEHSKIGGLGSAVFEAVSGIYKASVIMLGTEDRFLHVAGSREYLLKCHSLTVDQISEKIIKVYKSNA